MFQSALGPSTFLSGTIPELPRLKRNLSISSNFSILNDMHFEATEDSLKTLLFHTQNGLQQFEKSLLKDQKEITVEELQDDAKFEI